MVVAPRDGNRAESPSAKLSEELWIMKVTARIQDPYRNPFYNRFHVPVRSRLDEMQAFTHMVWLDEPAELGAGTTTERAGRNWRRALAGAFAIVLAVVFSVTLLSN